MAMATLNLKVANKRMLTAKEAAEYVGLPSKRFLAGCPVATVAMPGGVENYDIRDLDAWIDQLKNGDDDTDADIIGRL